MEYLLQKKLYILIAIGLIILFIYANTLNNSFAYDDHDFFVNWTTVKSLDNIPSLISGDLPLDHQQVYRPIRSLTQALAYQFFSTEPLGYHLLSLAIYIAIVYLAYLILAKITKPPIALIAAIIFAVLPVHVESVAFITASFDNIGILLMLSSFYCYLSSQSNKKYFYWLSIGLGLAAFFANELAIILPFIILLYDWVAHQDKKITARLKTVWPYLAGAGIYLATRFYILAQINSQSFLTELGPGVRILTALKSLPHYIYLTIFNWPLSIDHQTALSQSIFEPMVLLGIGLLATLIIAGWYFYYRANKPLYSFLIFWFIIALLPVSNLIRVSRFVSERYLLLASLAWSAILALFYFKIKNRLKPNAKIIANLIMATVILAYAGLTISRNNVWQNDETLWQSTLERQSGDVRSLINLAFSSRENGDYQSAEQYLNDAKAINPDYYLIYENFGELYQDQSRHQDAIANFQQAVKLEKNYFAGYNNIGFSYLMLGDIEQAKDNYLKALSIKPDFYQANLNLGAIYFDEKDYNNAIKHFTSALKVDNSNWEVHQALGLAYLYNGDKRAAQEEFLTALRLNPQDETSRDMINKLNN